MDIVTIQAYNGNLMEEVNPFGRVLQVKKINNCE